MKLLYFKNRLKNPYLWFSLVALLVTLLQKNIDIKFSHDSNWYIFFANRIGENLDFTRPPVFAPLYGWSLGFLNLIGINTLGSILVYWWFAYFFILNGFYLLLKNIGYSIICLIVVLSNLTTNSLFRFAWTELGYSVLLIFAVLSLYKLINSNNKYYKILFLISISILPLQRYIGGFISVYLGIIYLFLNNKNIAKRIIELSLTTIPISLIVLFNLFLSGHFSGVRKSATISLISNINSSIRVIYQNFCSEWIIYIFCIFIILISIKRRRSLFILFLFFTPLIQVGSQIYSNSTYQIDVINSRYFIVLTPLIVLLLVLFLIENFKDKYVSFQFYFLVLFFTLISSNLFILNNRNRIVKSDLPISYQKIKEFISVIPDNKKIGVFVKNTVFLQSELILASKIIPRNHCQSYKIKNDDITNNVSYIPKCNSLKGHVFIPIKYDTKIKPDYILIDKNGLKDDWKKYFNNYNMLDFGSFLALSK